MEGEPMKEAEVEIITPLHIGSGAKISPIEYLVDEEFIRVDMDSLFADDSFDKEKFMENAMKRLYLGGYAFELGKKYPKYTLKIDRVSKKNLISSLGNPNAEVREFIKTANRPFVPGSSLKGALRTVLLWKLLQDKGLRDKAEDMLKRPNQNPKHAADDEIEKLVFGKSPNYDFLKALQIYDSQSIDYKDLEVKEVKTLTTLQQGFGWKNFVTFVESLKEGTKLMCPIKIDDFYFSDIAKELNISDKKSILEQLPEVCNEFALEFINAELDFFNKINFKEMVEFYTGLKKETNKEGDFLLHLSWGSGWHGMTVGRLFQYVSGCFDNRCPSTGVCRFHNTIFCNVRNQYKLGAKWRRGQPPLFIKEFPKTRKIIFENGRPAYPMGWVRVVSK